jgi:hypothetical protein
MTQRLLLIGGIGAALLAAFFLFWALTWTEWTQSFVAVAFAALAVLLLWTRSRRVSAITDAP